MTVDTPTDRSVQLHFPTDNANHRAVYLDYNATTPVDHRVSAEVMTFMAHEFGNSGSRTHGYGQVAKDRVSRARAQVAAVVAAKPDEVMFTSGATESNNLAILGLASACEESGRKHIVSTQIEHKSVLEPLAVLAKRGFEVTLVPPTRGGWVDENAIVEALRPDTLLVSVMASNNETGVIQPIPEIAAALGQHDSYFHVDAAQAFGKLIGPLQDPRIDLLSVSGHKIFAPKGIGALVARRRGFRRIPLEPLMFGGGQERGLRPGTLPVALIAGLGLASELALKEHVTRAERASSIKHEALKALSALKIRLNGEESRTVPHTLNFSIEGVDAEAAIVALKDIVAVSNGSACTSQKYEPSHVLVAAEIPAEQINGALRFSWSHLTEYVPWDDVADRLSKLTK
ncbi:cysteine desulfurase DndA [Mycolicibacterium conceptionense]|uniref:cysteine desulfurase DndA n=1 Tax=Mycolicibacterium conceptionense TaxID=451644 RepID=UPI0007ECA6D6|nr:cysteine desulfurase DndA [Mycolicibacterium conceptionense]OBK02492.1 cysteine desulfurase DndA [Mycolicibacterium conceptionense]